jgi:acylphosphatase
VTATELRLSGSLTGEGFTAWICHRARLLNLSGWVVQHDAGDVTILVCGPAAMIDAMEVACSLGPLNVWVDRIESRPVTLETTPNGFHIH